MEIPPVSVAALLCPFLDLMVLYVLMSPYCGDPTLCPTRLFSHHPVLLAVKIFAKKMNYLEGTSLDTSPNAV